MKKFIFAWAILLLLAVSVLGQESPPADTAAATPPSADTGAVAPLQESTSADTGTIVTPPQESAPADSGAAARPTTDTAAVAPQPATPPLDTGTIVPPPQESVPTDTGAAAFPPADTGTAAGQQKETPADTGSAATPIQETVPRDTAAAFGVEEEATSKPTKPNRLGMGIAFNDEAPLSIRAWFNPKVGLDAGLGLRARRADDTTTITDSTPTPSERVTMLDLSFDLGIPIRILRKNKVDFILRPGFGFRTRPSFNEETPGVRSIETAVELEVNGSVGIEYYPFEKVGFSLQAGLALVTERTGGEISNTIIRFQSLPSKKGVNFAFRYYVF